VQSKEFFPSLISGPMASGMEIAFAVSAFCSVVAAIVSWFRGAPVIARDTAIETPRPTTVPHRGAATALQTGGRG
jgi:hypothetical protein